MDSQREAPPNLSEQQVELLQSAVQDGYFAVPRQTTLEELAGKHDITDITVSEDIRRAVEEVLRENGFGD